MLAVCPRIVALGVSIASLAVNVIVTVLPTVARVDVELLEAIATDVSVGPGGGGGGPSKSAYTKPGAANARVSSAAAAMPLRLAAFIEVMKLNYTIIIPNVYPKVNV